MKQKTLPTRIMNESETDADTGVTEELQLDDVDDNEIEEYEDISGADRAADETSSSSSGDSGDDNDHDSNKDNRIEIADESSNCSNSSDQNLSESEENNGEISRERNIFTKRTHRTSAPYNFQLMSQALSPGQSKFMENFDPERSNREKRKLTRKISTKKATLYDDTGLMGLAQLDICDCMSEECPGCHFPCPKCFSNKCGHECRQNRRWMYEEIHIEGTDIIIQNSAYYSSSEQG